VIMRYARDDSGVWPAKRPPMTVRFVGPLQERFLRTGRSLRVRVLKAPHPTLPAFHRPSLHAPAMPALPQFRVRKAKVMSDIRKRAARLRRREDTPEDEAPAAEPASA